jgi:hypothetical protein
MELYLNIKKETQMDKKKSYKELTGLEKEISDILSTQFSEEFQTTICKRLLSRQPYIDICCQEILYGTYENVHFTIYHNANSEDSFVIEVWARDWSRDNPPALHSEPEMIITETKINGKDEAIHKLCEIIRNEIEKVEMLGNPETPFVKAIKKISSKIKSKK